jgi:hypothetical protein
MEDSEIIKLVLRSIRQLFRKDAWLINHNLNERSISHKLATYLSSRFTSYHVDCEYNGDVDQDNQRKRIRYIQQNVLEEINNNYLPDEIVEASVFPDIIIHHRGSNDYNLCIIEIKKSTNRTGYDFDRLKLRSYTSIEYENNLQYQLGLLIILNISDNSTYSMELFKNGANVIV